MKMLVLSLFPGIGLLDMAFELEGFCVVRGPDLLWGGDVRRFHPPAGRFDGVIGGPPCQAFSSMSYLSGCKNSHENLIPEFERCIVEAQPPWFLMENVRQAPRPFIDGYITRSYLVNNRAFGEKQNRVRRFSFGTHDGRPLVIDDNLSILDALEFYPTIPAGHDLSITQREAGYKDSIEFRLLAQGLPADFLRNCPLTVLGKKKVIGNGVPLPMGRAIAKAVRRAVDGKENNEN